MPKTINVEGMQNQLSSVMALLDMIEIAFRDEQSLKMLHANGETWRLLEEGRDKLFAVREQLNDALFVERGKSS